MIRKLQTGNLKLIILHLFCVLAAFFLHLSFALFCVSYFGLRLFCVCAAFCLRLCCVCFLRLFCDIFVCFVRLGRGRGVSRNAKTCQTQCVLRCFLRFVCACFAFALRLFCVLFASQAKGARKAPPKTQKVHNKSATRDCPKIRDTKPGRKKHTHRKCKNESLGTPALWL